MELKASGMEPEKGSRNHGKVINFHYLTSPHILLGCGFWETVSWVESRMFADGLGPRGRSQQFTEALLRGPNGDAERGRLGMRLGMKDVFLGAVSLMVLGALTPASAADLAA